MKRFWDYIEQVKNKRTTTGKYIRKSIQRFEEDLRQSLENPVYPYYFDERTAQRVIDFVEALKHIKGSLAGKPIHLEPWQVFFVGNLYGWLKKDTNTRRFKKAFLFVARKNGKTLLGSALQVHNLLTEAGAEVYSIATTTAQANLSFFNAREFVKKNPDLSELLKLYQYEIKNENTAGFMKALSSEHNTHDGLNTSFCLADETSAHPDSMAVNVIKSSMKAREEPILLQITTAGYSTNSDNAGYAEYQLAKKLLDGTFKDDTFFPLLYEIDEQDDWKNPESFIKANPNIDVSVTKETLLEELNEALNKPSYQDEFLTKSVNRFLAKSSSKAWFSIEDIQKLRQPEPEERTLLSLPVVASIDLSKRIDFTAYTKYFYDERSKKFIAKHKFFIPEEQVEKKMKSDSQLIYQWIRDGHIIPTAGEVVDYEFLIDEILKDKQKYKNLNEIAFDKWSATDVVSKLKENFLMVEMEMNTRGLSEPSKDFETQLLQGNIIDNSPVSQWMISNAKIVVDNAGNLKIEKIDYRADSRRIDALITSVMALSRIKEVIKSQRSKQVDWANVVY